MFVISGALLLAFGAFVYGFVAEPRRLWPYETTGLFTLKFVGVLAVLYAIFLGVVALIPDLEQPLLASFVSPSTIVLLTIATLLYAWLRNAVLKQL